MRKLLFIIAIALLCACENTTPTVENYVQKNGTECVNIGGLDYTKFLLEGHDYLIRTWSTYCGTGSDIEHNPVCRKCYPEVEIEN